MTKPCKEFIVRLNRPAIPTVPWTCERCNEERLFNLKTYLRIVGGNLMSVCSKCTAELDNDKR